MFTVPNEEGATEADGTLTWDAVTAIVVEAVADEQHRGLGYTYGSEVTAALIDKKLRPLVEGRPVARHREVWETMVREVRNLGRPGIASLAISAVDAALWDLRARLADLPLHHLLGVRRTEVPIYGSGGFTSYDEKKLVQQLQGWVEQGIPRVKMKVGMDRGSRPRVDLARMAAVRQAIGEEPDLFIDANGAYTVKQVTGMAGRLQELGVVYLEEPVSSDQLDQLALVRRSVPFDIAAGEYGYDPWYFGAMVRSGAVDVLQADVSRCLGITGWLEAASLAHAAGLPFSAHCCPSQTVHAACAAPEIAHLEYFCDHVRVESLLFDGCPALGAGGTIRPDAGRPGVGLELKRADAERWRVG